MTYGFFNLQNPRSADISLHSLLLESSKSAVWKQSVYSSIKLIKLRLISVYAGLLVTSLILRGLLWGLDTLNRFSTFSVWQHLLWLPVCFPELQPPSEKGSSFPWGANSFL